MKYYTIIFTLLLFVSICDTTILWRIDVDPPAYILGTVHLPYTTIWSSLSYIAKSAFYNCTHYLPEFDMTNFLSFSQFRMCLNTGMPSLKNRPMPPPEYGGPDALETPILDIYLALEARRLNRNVVSLENYQIYCEFTKFQLGSLPSLMKESPPISMEDQNEQLKQLYNCDFNGHDEFFSPPPDNINVPNEAQLAFKHRLDELVARRDTNTVQKIDSILKGASPQDRFFFAVGYVHVMSPEGIITRLRRDYKYSVTRLCTDSADFRALARCQGPTWCDRISELQNL